jgi:hypothetical protein
MSTRASSAAWPGSAPVGIAARSARQFATPQPLSKKRKAVALAVAAAADILQLAVFPAFVEGAASPFEDGLDFAIAIVLLLVLGFQWRLLFAFALELVPGATLFPTWTAVVLSLPARAESDPQGWSPPPATRF